MADKRPKPAKPPKSGGGGAKAMAGKVLRIVGKTILGLFIFSIVWVLIYRFVPVPITILQATRCAEQLSAGKPMRLQKDWQPISNINNKLALAVVCAEDQKFIEHYGFDVEAIEKAMEHNKKSRRTRGASTISQQTAKNAFLWEGRTWVRKGLEVYFTFLIELMWPKERIMEVYLNIIEMGDGIYGAQAASKAYFKKDALKLSAHEAALIAAILPNPRRYSATRPSGYVRGRQAWIVGQMANHGGSLMYDEPDVPQPVKKKSNKKRDKDALKE
jgi:monofunctional biosynthetic peptidoglycan transglycosylase